MTLTLKKLQSMTDTVEVHFHGEKADVVYRVGAISLATFDQIEDVSKAAEQDEAEAVSELDMMMAEIVESWDVEVEPGKPFPLREKDGGPAAELAELPIPFKSAVLRQVMEHAQGKGEASDQRSRRGSLRRRK
jgi:hypothetical protein